MYLLRAKVGSMLSPIGTSDRGICTLPRSQALDLVFYGDSITEKWREFSDVYKAHFAKYRSIVLAIPGE